MTNYDILKEYEAHKTPVPSYEEWQSMDRLEKIMLRERTRLNKQVIELLEENQQLKGLLKVCKCEFEEITKFCNNEIKYAHEKTDNFSIPAECLAVITSSSDNKYLLTKIDEVLK